MIINTAGSRVIKRERNEVRRRTLLEVAKGDGTDNITNEPATRRRAVSDTEPHDFEAMVSTKDIKMEEIERGKKERRENQRKPIVQQRDILTRTKGSSFNSSGLGFQTAWIDIVSERDVKEITSTQKQTLRKFEETNEMLRHFNLLSESTFIELQKQYQSHVQLLSSLKNDLEQIFRRLRSLKEKVKEKYPEAIQATIETVQILKERQMMEMEYEVQKYNSIEESNAPTELLPSYSTNPNTMGSEIIAEGSKRVSTSILECDVGVADYKENQLVQNENPEDNEHVISEFVAMQNKTTDSKTRNELECYKESKGDNIGLQEGNSQLNASIASVPEYVVANETKEDIRSDSEVLSEKLNELDIETDSSGQKEMFFESITNFSHSIDFSEDNGTSCQEDTQNMVEQEQNCELNVNEDKTTEANTLNVFEEEKQNNVIN